VYNAYHMHSPLYLRAERTMSTLTYSVFIVKSYTPFKCTYVFAFLDLAMCSMVQLLTNACIQSLSLFKRGMYQHVCFFSGIPFAIKFNTKRKHLTAMTI